MATSGREKSPRVATPVELKPGVATRGDLPAEKSPRVATPLGGGRRAAVIRMRRSRKLLGCPRVDRSRSPRRSSIVTMCPTSATGTRRSRRTCSPAGTARRATTPGCSPAPTSTARRSCAPRRPTTWARASGRTSLVQQAWLPLLETLDIANDDFIRTTDEPPRAGRRRVRAAALRRRLHLGGRLRGLLLRRLRGVQADRRARRPARASTRASSSAPSTRIPVELLSGAELLLPDEPVHGAAARPLRGAARLRAAGERPQRGRLVREAGPRRPVDLALELRLGHPGALGRAPRRLRLVRRAAELHHRDRLRRRRGDPRPPLAGRCTSSARTSSASTPSSGPRC